MHRNCTRFVRKPTQDEIKEIDQRCRSHNRNIQDRAMVIKLSSDGFSVPEIVNRLNRDRNYVLRWIDRFDEESVSGLESRSKPGRPRIYTSDHDKKIINLIQERPEDLEQHFTTWSVPKLCKYMESQGMLIGYYRTVYRRLKEAKITLKKALKWMRSNDPAYDIKKAYRRTEKKTPKEG